MPAGSGEGGDDGVPVADGTLGDDESVGTTSSYSWTEAQKETMVEFLQEHDVFYNKSHNQFENTLVKKQLVTWRNWGRGRSSMATHHHVSTLLP